MNKKEFVELTSYHRYEGRPRENNVNALFFEWKSNDEGVGFKYCLFARACNATKRELVDTLYNYFRGRITEVDWWLNLVIAPSEQHRFKVPLISSGLNSLIKIRTHSNGQQFI